MSDVSYSYDGNSKEEELLKCPCCASLYINPVCLPCGHSVCACCLAELAREAVSRSTTCIVCDFSISPNISSCPRNVALEKLCEYLTDSAGSQSTEEANEVIFCDKHNGHEIDRFCLVCSKLICRKCESSSRDHDGHAIVSLNDLENRAEVFRRVKQRCSEEISAGYKELEVNERNLQNVRNNISSADNAFRLLESNIAIRMQEVFLRRQKIFHEDCRKEEVSLIKEGQVLKNRVTLVEKLLRDLKSNEKISGIQHVISSLRAFPDTATAVPDSNTRSAHSSYSSKLREELNMIVDECAHLLTRIKSPSARKEQQDEAGEKRSEDEAVICTCATSSPISCPQLSFSEFLEKFPEEKESEHELDKCKTDDKVSFLVDKRTGEKYHIGIDDVLNVGSLSTSEPSSIIDSFKAVSDDDSLPEFDFLLSSNCLKAVSRSEVILTRVFGCPGDSAGEFNEPEGLAVNNAGNIYVADSQNNRVQVFDGNFEYLFSFGERSPGILQTPLDVAIYPKNKAVIVADSHNNKIQFFSENGEFLETFGSKGDALAKCDGTSVGCFQIPNAIAVNSRGHMIITDTGNNRIQIITSDGTDHSLIIGKKGSGPLEFHHPTGVAVDKYDNIVVADYGNNRIQVLSFTGEFLYSFGEGMLSRPSCVAVSPRGNIFVSDLGNKLVKIFDRNGNFAIGFGHKGTKSTSFKHPGGITWLPDGHLVVSDVFSSKLRLFDCLY